MDGVSCRILVLGVRKIRKESAEELMGAVQVGVVVSEGVAGFKETTKGESLANRVLVRASWWEESGKDEEATSGTDVT